MNKSGTFQLAGGVLKNVFQLFQDSEFRNFYFILIFHQG